SKRNLIAVAQVQALAQVELRVRPVERQRLIGAYNRGRIIDKHAENVEHIVNAVAPGVIGIEGEVLELAQSFKLQRIVVRGANALHLNDRVESWIDAVVDGGSRSRTLCGYKRPESADNRAIGGRSIERRRPQ